MPSPVLRKLQNNVFMCFSCTSMEGNECFIILGCGPLIIQKHRTPTDAMI